MIGSRGCCGHCWGWVCWLLAAWRSACFGRSLRLRRRFRRTAQPLVGGGGRAKQKQKPRLAGRGGFAGDAASTSFDSFRLLPPTERKKKSKSCLAGRSL